MTSLSVIIGSKNSRSTIGKCLRSVQTQLARRNNGQHVEVIVVDGSTDGAAEFAEENFPAARILRCDRNKLMPELWEIGVSESKGEVVAITTAHFVPEDNWIEEILRAHDGPFDGVGGAIENDQDTGLVTWAIYFCRYSPYMLPFEQRVVNDFAGDNASYKRSALDQVSHARRKGFWESFIHDEMNKTGMQLAVIPRIVVRHQRSMSLPEFINQRFWHGRQFGSERSSKVSFPRRVIYLIMSPLIPLIYLQRITRRVLSRRRHIGPYLLSLPILILFLLSWSTGEWTGYLWASQGEA